MAVEGETSVDVVFNVFKEVVMTVAQEAVGYRICKGREKGSAWWTDEIKGAVEEKKKAYKKMLQKNVAVRGSARRRRSEYKVWNKKVKELVDDSKMRVDEEFGRKLSEVHEQKTILERGEERGDAGGVSENEEGGWNAC